MPETDARSPIILVSLLELGKADRESAVLSDLKATPVFITDDPDFSIFVASRHLYEYLPSIRDQLLHDPGRDWAAYLVRRLRVILDKWRPARVANIGTNVDEFVAKVRRAHAEYCANPPQFVAARHVGMHVTYGAKVSQ